MVERQLDLEQRPHAPAGIPGGSELRFVEAPHHHAADQQRANERQRDLRYEHQPPQLRPDLARREHTAAGQRRQEIASGRQQWPAPGRRRARSRNRSRMRRAAPAPSRGTSTGQQRGVHPGHLPWNLARRGDDEESRQRQAGNVPPRPATRSRSVADATSRARPAPRLSLTAISVRRPTPRARSIPARFVAAMTIRSVGDGHERGRQPGHTEEGRRR